MLNNEIKFSWLFWFLPMQNGILSQRTASTINHIATLCYMSNTLDNSIPIETIIYTAGVHGYYIHTALSDLYASYSLEFPSPSGIQIVS